MSDFSAVFSTAIRPTGTIIAPPTPCSTRMITSMVRLWLSAQPSEARVKITIADRKTGRVPYRRVSQLLSGISTASVIRYAAETRPTAAGSTPNASAIRGAEVVTMVPSKFSMKKQPATRRAVLRRRLSIISSPTATRDQATGSAAAGPLPYCIADQSVRRRGLRGAGGRPGQPQLVRRSDPAQHPLQHDRPVELHGMGPGPQFPLLPLPLGQPVGDQVQRVGDRPRVAGRHDQRGVADRLPDAAGVGGDHRSAAGEHLLHERD